MKPVDEGHGANGPTPEGAGNGTGSQGGAKRVPGAGGVVFDRLGRVLVLRHADGDWVFPKGHPEPGESLLQTALREVREEAGVDATCEDEETTWTTEYTNPRGERREITWFAFRTDAEAPTLTEDLFPEGEFLPPAEALRRLTHEPDRALLGQLLGDAGEETSVSEEEPFDGSTRVQESGEAYPPGRGPEHAADAGPRPGGEPNERGGDE